MTSSGLEPASWAFLEKPPILQLLKNFPAFYGTWRLVPYSQGSSTGVVFEVPIEAAMKNSTFWHIKPCSLVEVHRRFEGTYWLYIQNREKKANKIEAETNKVDCFIVSVFGPEDGLLLAWIILQSWRWKQCFPPKRWWNSTGRHEITFKANIFFHLLHLID
jgi:hypothetical protein